MARTKKRPATGPVWNGSDDLRSMLVPTGDLSHDPGNVRRHDERNRGAIRASLSRYGQLKPVVCDLEGVVRAGNGTLAVAREMGWTHIAVTRSALDATELVGYGIADNRTSDLSDFDFGELAETLKELQAEGFDIEAAGYTDDELDRLVEGLSRPEPDEPQAGSGDGEAEASDQAECPKCGCRFTP